MARCLSPCRIEYYDGMDVYLWQYDMQKVYQVSPHQVTNASLVFSTQCVKRFLCRRHDVLRFYTCRTTWSATSSRRTGEPVSSADMLPSPPVSIPLHSHHPSPPRPSPFPTQPPHNERNQSVGKHLGPILPLTLVRHILTVSVLSPSFVAAQQSALPSSPSPPPPAPLPCSGLPATSP